MTALFGAVSEMLIYYDFCTGTYPKFGQYYTHVCDQSDAINALINEFELNTCENPVRRKME